MPSFVQPSALSHIISIILELMLHLGSKKYRSDPNAESDTSDAESELANELFADYLSGVA